MNPSDDTTDKGIEIVQEGLLHVVYIRCVFDFMEAEFLENLRDQIDTMPHDCCFDFSKTPYITTSGVAVMIKVIKHVMRNGLAARIRGYTEDMKTVLETLNISHYLIFE